MTKEEAIKFVQNKKIYVGKSSKEVQEKLFELDYSWLISGQTIQHEKVQFIFTGITDNLITSSDNLDTFFSSEKEQLSMEELFNIQIDKEFKDGDYIALYKDKELIYISIFKGYDDPFRLSHAYIWENYISIQLHGTGIKNDGYIIQDASLDQINELNTKLKDLGKYFNKETKCIEDIKPEFTPFQKVLVRDEDYEDWKCEFFSHFDKGSDYSFVCTSGPYTFCIPYEGNEHLIGKVK